MPKDKITGTSQSFAFVEFETVEDAEYCVRVLGNVKLYGRHVKINRAAKQSAGEDGEFNAKLFIGNLDMEVDEKQLFDTFAQFGAVLSAKVMTEVDSDKSRGFGFCTFDSFEAADRAIECMNGQYLGGRPVSVGYAFTKVKHTRASRKPVSAWFLAAAADVYVCVAPAGSGWHEGRASRLCCRARAGSQVDAAPFAQPRAEHGADRNAAVPRWPR